MENGAFIGIAKDASLVPANSTNALKVRNGREKADLAAAFNRSRSLRVRQVARILGVSRSNLQERVKVSACDKRYCYSKVDDEFFFRLYTRLPMPGQLIAIAG